MDIDDADQLLLCDPAYRDLFSAWQSGEITLGEASFLARRVAFNLRMGWLPIPCINLLLQVYDLVFEWTLH